MQGELCWRSIRISASDIFAAKLAAVLAGDSLSARKLLGIVITSYQIGCQ